MSSTVLTLLVLPTLYNLVEGAKERRAARRAGTAADGSDAGTEVLEPALVGAAAAGAAGAAGGSEPVLTRRELRARDAAAAAGLTAGAVVAAGAADVEVPPLEEGPDVEMPEGAVAGVVVDAEYVENASPGDEVDTMTAGEAVEATAGEAEPGEPPSVTDEGAGDEAVAATEPAETGPDEGEYQGDEGDIAADGAESSGRGDRAGSRAGATTHPRMPSPATTRDGELR